MAALQSSSPFSAIDLTKAFDTVSREGLWKILARLGCPPKFLTILCQLHEGQMGQVKHNGALSDSLPNGFKQGCVLAPTLFSILFSLMLREAKEDLVDSIFIRFRTDGSIFNLRRLLAHTKTIEVLIVELLFADDCALLAHTQEALQYIVNHFAEAAKAFGFTISLKKTEVLHQPPPGGVYSPPQINIEGTSLNSVEHFTYLGSVISNDATVNKDFDNRLARVSSAFGRLHKRVWQNHSLRLSTKIQVYRALWSLPYCTAARHGCCTTSRSGCWSDFIMGIKWQEYVTNEEVLKRASLPSLECTLLQQQLRWAGHVARMEDSRMPKAVFFGELREGKCKCRAPKKRYKDQLKKQLSLTEIPLHSWQQEANSRENCRKVVGSASHRFECSRRDAAEGKRKKRKERMTSQSAVSTYTHICPRCSRACASRISLYSHQRACRTTPTH